MEERGEGEFFQWGAFFSLDKLPLKWRKCSKAEVDCGDVSGVSPLFPTEKGWEGGPKIVLWGTGEGRSCHWGQIHTRSEVRGCLAAGNAPLLGVTAVKVTLRL